MKMNHTPIEATNPFAEAANGGQPVPGQGGVTGGGEAHEAWNRAVAEASIEIDGGAIPEGMDLQSDELALASIVGMGDQKRTDEVSVSWDRLSMTVASMVAWNMQVEMVEESPAGEMLLAEDTLQVAPIEPGSPLAIEETAQTLSEGIELDSGLAIALSQAISDSNVKFQGDDSSDTKAASALSKGPDSFIGSASEVGKPLAVDQSGISDGLDMVQQANPSSVMNLGESQLITQNSTDMLSVKPAQELGGTGLDIDLSSLATASDNQMSPGDISLEGMGVASGTTNGMSLAASQNITDSTVVDPDVLTPDATVKTDSAKPSPVSTKPVDTGLERLAGIRAAIAELDAHVAKSSQTSSPTDPSAELKGRLAEIEMTYRVSRDVIHGTSGSNTKNVPVQSTENTTLNTGKPVKTSNEEGLLLDAENGDSSLSRRAPGVARNAAKPEMASGIHRPGRMGQSSGTTSDFNTQMTFTESNASITGTTNSEISSDVDRKIEFAEFDAANIDAGEVPELPIADLSQLDIDIDDPAGHVRLALSKEAEEVVVRLETPEEVVQEYREMEEEIGKQLARQGLGLADFSADSHGDGSEDGAAELTGEKESNQNAQTDVTTGEQTLEETGDSARLVNRIV